MAKSKKSKILASMLAVSTMAVFYAAPVMAADNSLSASGGSFPAEITVKEDGSIDFISKGWLGGDNFGPTRIASFGDDSFKIYNGSGSTVTFEIDRMQGTFSANGGAFRVESGGNVITAGTLSAAGGAFDVDADGNVVSLGNVTSTDGNITYNLNTVGANTAGIVRKNVNAENKGLTEIEGTLAVNGQSKVISTFGGELTIDGSGNLRTVNDVVSSYQNQNYSLNTIGANTAGIRRANDGTSNVTVVEENLWVYDDGTIVGANENFRVTSDGTVMSNGLNVGDGNFTVSDTGIGAYGSKFTVNTSGEVSTTGINVNGGTFTAAADGISMANGNVRVDTNGTVYVGEAGTTNQTIIDSGTISTDTLKVENIMLGGSMTDEDDNSVAIGADGTLKVNNENYSLNLDENGFNLSNAANTSTFTLGDNGFAFNGPTHLGNGSQVEFSHNGTDISLSSLVDRVETLEEKTTGISFDTETGNTTITDMNKQQDGTWSAGDSSMTVGDNGTTFENGEGNGTTNINGSEIVSDATNVGGGSGSGSGFGGGTSTTNGDNAVYVGEDGDYTHVSSDGVTIGDQTNTNTTNIDKDGMVVDGETGNTHISEGGMTVTDKTDGSTTNIDGNGMVVDGSNGTNHISDSGMTITGKDGNTTNNISDKGMTVTGDNGTTNISGGDISVDNSVTVAGGSENKTTINNDGITVGDKGTSIKNDSISVGDGGYIGGGDVRSGEGVSLNQTAERVGHLENRVGELEDRIDKVGAMAAAIANLRSMGYDPAAPTEVAVGIGQYRDETGAALGLFHYPNRDFMLSLSVSTSGDEVMGGIGATWKFGRKSPEKVAEIKKAQKEADIRRAEAQKLEKAEEMKKAAKEAKIKAQQERHAKLAAERAAQAEG